MNQNQKTLIILFVSIFLLAVIYFISHNSSKNSPQQSFNKKLFKNKKSAEEKTLEETIERNAASIKNNEQIPPPIAPEGISWKLDYHDESFASFQAFKDGHRVYQYEVRVEKIKNKWEQVEGIAPPSADTNSPAFPDKTEYQGYLDELSTREEQAQVNLFEKVWFIGIKNQYQPILLTELSKNNGKKEFVFINANSGEIVKRTPRSRH